MVPRNDIGPDVDFAFLHVDGEMPVLGDVAHVDLHLRHHLDA